MESPTDPDLSERDTDSMDIPPQPAPRVIVGRDAVAATWLQRLFPVDYWKHAARDIARRTRAA